MTRNPVLTMVAVALVLATPTVAYVAFRVGNPVLAAALVVGLCCIPLVQKPQYLFILGVSLYRSELIFPGVPAGLQVYHLVVAAFVALSVARLMVRKTSGTSLGKSRVFFYAFAFTVLITMCYRGTGLRFLGSHLWGGMHYVDVFLAVAFLMFSGYVRLNLAEAKSLVILIVCFSFVPALAELIFLLSRGSVTIQYMFVTPYIESLAALQRATTEGGVVRLRFLAFSGRSILAFALVFVPFRRLGKMILCLAVGASFLMVGLSGFRGAMISMILTLLLFILLVSGRRRYLYMSLMGGAVAAMIILAASLGEKLPMSAQRVLCWVPFAHVSPVVQADARYSTQWRLAIWKVALREAPKYLWIGRGFAFNPERENLIVGYEDTPYLVYLTGNYHSGPLSALVDLGIMGLVTITGFFFTSLFMVFRERSRVRGRGIVDRFYDVTLAGYAVSVFSYYFIFGDVKVSFPSACLTVAVLRALARSSPAREEAEPYPSPGPAPVVGESPAHPAIR